MTVEIKEISGEDDSFIRSCKANINGKSIITPTRTVSLTKSNNLDLNVASSKIDKNYYRPLGEVFTRISIDSLNQMKNDDKAGQDFSSIVSEKLQSLKKKGAVPYLVISITDNDGNPYRRMLPNELLNFIFDILWGTPGNSIIVPPLLGLLPERKDYQNFISALEERVHMDIHRKEMPIMAPIPSSYNLIEPNLLQRYWDLGCRIFAFNCVNKKYGAFGYMIERLHRELTNLSRDSGDDYILNAFNTKFKVGKQDSSRINNLLGTGFGFDIYGPNHIPPKYVPNTSQANFYLFNPNDYGFETLSDVSNNDYMYDDILQSDALKNVELEEINKYSGYKKRKITNMYNIEKSIDEVSSYCKYIKNNELYEYLSEKPKIEREINTMEDLATNSNQNTHSLSEWF